MPKKVLVVVEGYLPNDPTPPDSGDAHPEHPIYIPVDPPPESGLSPEHPIYIPVEPPGVPTHPIAGEPGVPTHPIAGEPGVPTHPIAGEPGVPAHPIYLPIDPPPDMGLGPSHPIYIPVEPTHPIVLPPPVVDNELPPVLTDEQKDKLVAFLEFHLGNLPPEPAHPSPV